MPREKLQPWDTTPLAEEPWRHDPRGFTFDDFHRLRRQPNDKTEVRALSRSHSIAARFAIEHGGFTRDEGISFIHRTVITELSDMLKIELPNRQRKTAGRNQLLGGSEIVQSIYAALLASSQPDEPEQA